MRTISVVLISSSGLEVAAVDKMAEVVSVGEELVLKIAEALDEPGTGLTSVEEVLLAVHLAQIVDVSVIRTVEVLGAVNTEVTPWLVTVCPTGQVVTVVRTISVISVSPMDGVVWEAVEEGLVVASSEGSADGPVENSDVVVIASTVEENVEARLIIADDETQLWVSVVRMVSIEEITEAELAEVDRLL